MMLGKSERSGGQLQIKNPDKPTTTIYNRFVRWARHLGNSIPGACWERTSRSLTKDESGKRLNDAVLPVERITANH
jgi:hypothetical protein